MLGKLGVASLRNRVSLALVVGRVGVVLRKCFCPDAVKLSLQSFCIVNSILRRSGSGKAVYHARRESS